MSAAERTIVLHVDFYDFDEQTDFAECLTLARSAGADVVDTCCLRLSRPLPKFFIGSGKAEELAGQVAAHKVELVLVNHRLTPAQERNLEQKLQCRVCDRTRLILDIFARRARTHEGKLQVELAQLNYMATRLVRGWTHLERQRGGRIGMTGPGETQLEIDRRLLRQRIKYIQQRLEKVRKHRQLSRQARQRSEVPTVAFVGYTNAGKSTLFNVLTDAHIYAADQLFATLDPTLRQVSLPGVGKAILADTVGFIRYLPHDLVAAFRATLEEVTSADLLLHVVDASDPKHLEYIDQVNLVLSDIGAETQPILLAYNKIDLTDNHDAGMDVGEEGLPARVWVSAHKKQGLDVLQEALATRLMRHRFHATIALPMTFAKLRAALYAQQAVVNESLSDDIHWLLEINLPFGHWEVLCREHHFDNERKT